MLHRYELISKISEAALLGRGGASYPVAEKWQSVKSALKKGAKAYIVVNCAEGEPGVKKDAHILKHYPDELVNGIFLAYNFFGAKIVRKVYIFISKKYYKDYANGLHKIFHQGKYQSLYKKIEFIIKPDNLSYISGEETSILNLIEKKRNEPRLKPPYPTFSGLWDSPTLIHNTETLYDISLVSKGQYEGKRFYTVGGMVKHPGVYHLAATLSIEDILRASQNWPNKSFFVQVGGEASGEVLSDEQLSGPVEGAGSITVYDKQRSDERKLIKYWLRFYRAQSCGQCSPCREGVYRLEKIFDQESFDDELFWQIIETLENSSLCALGSSLAVPLKSYFKNIKNKNL